MSIAEKWVAVKGYEDYYQVSNFGRVRSLQRIVKQQSRWGTELQRIMPERIMNPTDNGNGYLIVGLVKQGKRKNFYVHRLVAEAFLGYVDGAVINHIDYNTQNNNENNLEIVTQKENVLHSVEHLKKPKKTMPSMSGEKHIRCRKGKYDVEIIYKGKCWCFGRFDTMEEAKIARENAYEKIHYYR